MKNLRVASLTLVGLLVSGMAMADLVASSPVLMFGDVALGQTATETILITNTGDRVVQQFAVSISGNSKEFVISNSQSLPTIIFPGNSLVVFVSLVPQHYGSKRRKLNVDGIEILDDGSIRELSLVAELIGTSDNPNQP